MEEKELTELTRQVASRLPGWDFVPYDPGSNRPAKVRSSKFKMEFYFHYPHYSKKDRVSVSVGWEGWPVYTKFSDGHNGEPRKERVMPHELYNPKGENPSITCSLGRGVDAITRDVERRFIPAYAAVYERCLEKAMQTQEYEDKTRNTWERVCKAIGADPKWGRTSADTTEENHVTVERRGGDKVFLSFYATAEQTFSVLKALGGKVK